MRILVLCTGNSSRSQMAEGILKQIDSSLEVFSAGTNPVSKVSSKAIKVMREVGIDISGNTPKHVDQFIDQSFNYVITVCDHTKETCPIFSGKVDHRLHMGFEDPAEVKGSASEVLSVYRKVRDDIRNGFIEFYNQNIKR